jgi:hypothetical protein
LCPLFVGLLLALLCLEQSVAQRESALQFVERPWIAVSVAAILSSITLFLITRRSGTETVFHWLFVCGLSCLGLPLFAALHEYSRSYPWDPYGIAGYEILARILPMISTLFLGLAFIITALIQDHLYPRANPRD